MNLLGITSNKYGPVNFSNIFRLTCSFINVTKTYGTTIKILSKKRRIRDHIDTCHPKELVCVSILSSYAYNIDTHTSDI